MRDPGRPSTASSAGIAASPPHRRAPIGGLVGTGSRWPTRLGRSARSSGPPPGGGPLASARRGPAQPLLTPQAPGAPLAYRVALATQQRVRGLPALPRMGTGDGPERRRTGPPPPRAPALRDPEAIDEHDHCPPATLRGQKSRPQTPVRSRCWISRLIACKAFAGAPCGTASRAHAYPHGSTHTVVASRARRARWGSC